MATLLLASRGQREIGKSQVLALSKPSFVTGNEEGGGKPLPYTNKPGAAGRTGFTLETRRLLGRLAGQRGLWVLREGLHTENAQTARGKPLPYPSGKATGSEGYGGQAARLAPPTARLAHYFLLAALLRGERALFLDAANCFNPHRLTAMIARVNERRQGASPCPTQAPEELLGRVRLSRAFTCFQLAELVERVPRCAGRYGARCVFVTGVPEIFDDEELEANEARRVFLRALGAMRRWRANERGLPLSTLVFNAVLTPLRAPRRWLETQLARAADGVFRFQETPEGLAVRERNAASPDRLRHSLRQQGSAARALVVRPG